MSLHEDRRKSMWVGSYSGGLGLFDAVGLLGGIHARAAHRLAGRERQGGESCASDERGAVKADDHLNKPLCCG